MQNKSSMGDTARNDSLSVICLPILKVNMQIPLPRAARGIARMPVCGPFSVSTGQNYFGKLSPSVNIFLTFSLSSCHGCECCMSSLKLPGGIVSVAVHFSSLFCVFSEWCHQAKRREKEWHEESQGIPVKRKKFIQQIKSQIKSVQTQLVFPQYCSCSNIPKDDTETPEGWKEVCWLFFP